MMKNKKIKRKTIKKSIIKKIKEEEENEINRK